MSETQSSPNYSYSGKDILITGGTGSLGTSLIKYFCSLPESIKPDRIVCLSRDWKDQAKLRAVVLSKSLRTFIGDIRDLDRLFMAFRGVDYVIHTAAIKSIVDCEYNPMEAVLTNVVGTWNVIRAAIDAKVERVEFISSDKATSPVATYGKSKALAESLIVASGSYAPQTKFFAVRYGNVLGSNGSVLPIFLNQARLNSPFTITDPEMTRYWISLSQATDFVVKCLNGAAGVEIFIPKLRSSTVADLARAIDPDRGIKYIGKRAGEKTHESLVSYEELGRLYDIGWSYYIEPEFPFWNRSWKPYGKLVPSGNTQLSSDAADRFSNEELRALISEFEHDRV